MNIKENLSGHLANFISGGRYRRAVQEAQTGQIGQGYFRERLWELESSLLRGAGDGWGAVQIAVEGGDDFGREALRAMHRLALVMYLKNPLIKRGIKIQSQYVFGQGVSVHIEGDEGAAQVWRDFWDHEDNQRELTSRTRLAQVERKLQIKGNLFFAFYIDRVFGRCQMREIDVDEFEDALPCPDDANKPAFYKRVYSARILDAQTGRFTTENRVEYYPDIAYNPADKPQSIGGAPVLWDSPVLHVARERVSKIGFAPSEVFAQIDWAKAYTKFLENRATVAAALSRIVLKFSSATKSGVQKSKERLMTSFGKPKAPDEDGAGGAAHLREGSNVEAVGVKGATIHPDEGRRFLLMVCAGFGFGETMFGDVSVGTLATATSLDRPTELAMMECQQGWKETLETIASFVLRVAVAAPANPLSRRARLQNSNGRLFVAGDAGEVKVNVDFPPLLHHEVEKQVAAIVLASSHIPLPKLIARHLLTALGEDDLDDALAMLPNDETLAEWPHPEAMVLPEPIVADPLAKQPSKSNGKNARK